MSSAQVAKGKLELMLDEFTEVHGTVLMGMHKELQTLKQEVDKRVEERISAVLTKIDAADAVLRGHLESAEQVAANLDGKEKRVASVIAATKKEGILELEATRDAILAEGAVVRQQFTEERGLLQLLGTELHESFEVRRQAALIDVDSVQSSWKKQVESATRSLQSLDADIRASSETRHQEAINDLSEIRQSWEQQAELIKNSLRSIETKTSESLEARHRAAMDGFDTRQADWEAQAGSIERTLRDLETTLQGELYGARIDAVGAIVDQQRLWDAAAKKTVDEFSVFRGALNSLCFELEGKLADQELAISKALVEVSEATHEQLVCIRDEGVTEIRVLHSEVKQEQSNFEQFVTEHEKRQADFQCDIAKSTENLSLIQKEHQTKMSAALSVADKLNTESQGLLNEVAERTEQLHQKESALQSRTRQVVIGIGFAVISTLCTWIWLTLQH